LVIRRDPDVKLTFTLLNDPADTDFDTLVRASCQRHWVERVIEDGKFELGWDDFCARKYLAWEHHVALTAAALWFIAQVKLGWKESYQRDPRRWAEKRSLGPGTQAGCQTAPRVQSLWNPTRGCSAFRRLLWRFGGGLFRGLDLIHARSPEYFYRFEYGHGLVSSDDESIPVR
jgi:hypothetical protein